MAERFDLSAAQARRIAIAAQGLAGPPPPGPPTAGRLRKLVDALGVIQIDSVNVLTRSHYLPPFARLGPYPREILEREAWGKARSLFEYWGHEASFLPLASQPLFRWRMERALAGETWSGLAKFSRERRDYIESVVERIEREGPLTGGDFADAPRQAGWWSWSDGKRALEWLFWTGRITTKTRRGFERVYDLTERVLPAVIVNAPTPNEADAHRELLRVSARAMGVATEGDLRVQATHLEPGAPEDATLRLSSALHAMAGWLDLEQVLIVKSHSSDNALRAHFGSLRDDTADHGRSGVHRVADGDRRDGRGSHGGGGR